MLLGRGTEGYMRLVFEYPVFGCGHTVRLYSGKWDQTIHLNVVADAC
ncbi:hypothetical protein JYU04_03825 [Dehalococcoides mccartyi]|nr:hypothetical protein [Dehalococcoides mccartyi]